MESSIALPSLLFFRMAGRHLIAQQRLRTGSNRDGDHLTDEEDLDDDNDGMPDEADSCRQGESGWHSSQETDYDSDGCRDETEDDDDDNDGMPDEQDSCLFSPLGFKYPSPDDTDEDGCHDRDEDEDLVGVTSLTVIPAAHFLLLKWINPNASLSSISIHWFIEEISIDFMLKIDQLDPAMEASAFIRALTAQQNYTLQVTPHYANGGTGNSVSAQIWTGANYDNDNVADLLDEDDDNDNVSDRLDKCHPRRARLDKRFLLRP